MRLDELKKAVDEEKTKVFPKTPKASSIEELAGVQKDARIKTIEELSGIKK